MFADTCSEFRSEMPRVPSWQAEKSSLKISRDFPISNFKFQNKVHLKISQRASAGMATLTIVARRSIEKETTFMSRCPEIGCFSCDIALKLSWSRQEEEEEEEQEEEEEEEVEEAQED